MSIRVNPNFGQRTTKTAAFLLAILALLVTSLQLPAPSLAGDEQPYTFEMAQVEEGTVWYLAEGCTEGTFETYILVQNPGDTPAQVTLTFMTSSGLMEGPTETLDPHSRKTWAANSYVTSWDVSTKVTSDVPIIAERAVYWDGKKGGHDAMGVTTPSHVWYLAEGCTGGDYETYILVQNPADNPANVSLTFMTGEGPKEGPSETLAPGTRKTWAANSYVTSWDVSTKVTSDVPVIAERAVYWGGKADGHDCAGVTIPCERWYLAEGCTGGDFETYILVQNPGSEETKVKITYQGASGPIPGPEITVPERSRQTVNAATTCPGLWDVSTLVEADSPVIVERAMYWRGKDGGHDSAGVTTAERTWYLAEGCTGGDFETYILVQNPGGEEAKVKITYQASGSIPGPELTIPAGSRQTVNAAATCPGLWDVSTLVEADVPVIAERAVYWAGKGGGHDAVGYPLKQTEVAEATEVLSEASTSKIASVSGDQKTITFSASSPQVEGLAVGDIITCGVGPKTPAGMLRKVTKIEENGGQVILTTTQATLEEALRRGSLNAGVALTPEMVVSAQPLVEGVDLGITDYSAAGLKFNVPMNDVVLYDADGNKNTTGDQVKLKGGVSFEPKFDIDMQIDYDPSRFWEAPELKKFSFTTTLNETANIEIVAEAKILDLKKEIELAKYTFSPITFMVGPVPVVLVPTLTLKVGANAQISVNMTTGITQKATLTGGLSYSGGIWEPISGFENDFDFNAPKLTAEATAKAYVKPQLSLMLYTLAGPHASIEGYLQLTANPENDPWWELYAGIKGDIGVELKVISKVIASYSKTVFDKKWLLASAPPQPVQKWEKTFGGTDSDYANSAQQTKDGGYILAGSTIPIGAEEWDAYLVKTDASGNLMWQKTFGGVEWDEAYDVQQTSDGGYILAGITLSFGAGEWDVYLVKTDASGNLMWEKTFGGASDDWGGSVQQTTDGGYILAGSTSSFGAGNNDAYLIKTDSSGNLLWQKSFGGTDSDYASSVQQTSDGGYILAGATETYGAGGQDAYLIKTNASGNFLWQKTFGGSDKDRASSVQQTSDSGYILAGETRSFGEGVENVYLIKTNVSGSLLWQKTYGGSSWSEAYSVQQTAGGGYILAGTTNSFGAGYNDAYLIKTNVSGSLIWQKTYGGEANDLAESVQQTSDGGYILAGYTESLGAGVFDAYLIKTDASGNLPRS